MTDKLRHAALEALEALETSVWCMSAIPKNLDAALTALRTALMSAPDGSEQPAEQEPAAAWENKYGMKEWEVHALRAGWMPASPQPRKRLTDEEIKAFAMEAFDSSWDADDETLVNKYGHGVYLWRFVDFARAIEDAIWSKT